MSTEISTIRKIRRHVSPVIEKYCPFITFTYRTLRDDILLLSEPSVTPMGFRFSGYTPMRQGNYEPMETDIMVRYFSEADIFINVGANFGYFCCIALNMGKHTIAFEPLPGNLKLLYRNIKINGYDNVEIYPIAISNTTGVAEIYGSGIMASLVPGWNKASPKYKNCVPVSTLDNVIGDRLNGKKVFILADIEGSERKMLEGATKILRQTPRPVWMLEISAGENYPDGRNPNLLRTFEIMWDNGYTAYTADSDFRLLQKQDIEHLKKGGNFLFK